MSDKDAKESLVVEGYSGDSVPPGIQLKSYGSLTELQTYKGFYDVDTFGGTSGAGVFVADPTNAQLVGADAQLVGVHTNGPFGSDLPWSKFNAFTRITPERLVRVQEWIGK